MSNVYDFEADTISGQASKLDEYKGKVLLVVNTASKCGLTPQFKGLEELHNKYKDKGLQIIGFPCNQFGHQDPGSNDEIQEFCQMNYGVSFPMFAKIDVNGDNTHPLYQHLKTEAPGLLGSEKIKWNFTKFLVNKNGEVIKRFAPATKPEKLESAIKSALAS
jgi:glutathione peroxidase